MHPTKRTRIILAVVAIAVPLGYLAVPAMKAWAAGIVSLAARGPGGYDVPLTANDAGYLNVSGTVNATVSDGVAVQFYNGGRAFSVAPANGGTWTTSGTATITGTVTTNPQATTSSVTSEVLVLNSGMPDGGQPVPASPLSGRRAIELFNSGPNTIYCTADGTNPVATKARPIASNASWSLDCDPTACPIKCIAATANQITGAATIATEIK